MPESGRGGAATRARMHVAGVMSGTSADGIEVALCRIARGSADSAPKLRLLHHQSFRYPRAVREAVLRAMDARAIAVRELSQLNWRLGQMYADAVERTAQAADVRVNLVGCHGQTLFHQPTAQRVLGSDVRSTWQTGEAACVVERMRCPVVSDFRPADMAAGGQGAPLVPALDRLLFASERVHRVLVNVGGIANVTVLPAGARAEEVVAFDTGPGNMVMDGCMRRLFGREYDRNGATAARGQVLEGVLAAEMRHRYFRLPPPKSCGREQFGDLFSEQFLKRCQAAGGEAADAVATATALTARSLLSAYARYVHEDLRERGGRTEWVVAGGGTRNGTLLRMLEQELRPYRVRLRLADEFGVPAEAKEAVAFAYLAWLTWHRLPANLPSATGAERPVVLGKISFA